CSISINGPVTTNQSTFTPSIAGNILLTGAIANTFQVADGGPAVDLDVPAMVAGPGSLVKNGSGALRLSAANTFSGGLTLNAGTLRLGNNSAAGSGLVTISGGNVQADGAARTIGNGLSLSGSFGTTGSLDLTFTGSSTLTANLAIQNDSSGATTF